MVSMNRQASQVKKTVRKIRQILLVEDNSADAHFLQETLKDTGMDFGVVVCQRLTEAVEQYHNQHFDLVILDLSLPDATWYDTLLYLKTIAFETPTIVITVMQDNDIALQSIRAGAQDYLPKGVYDTELLTRTILHTMERFELLKELKLAREQERMLAYYDVLTRLPNRRSFEEHLAKALQQAYRNDEVLALLFIDLDKFKPINDQLGHDAGDQLLVMIAQRLRQSIRGSDITARFGGDEFIVLLRSLTAAEQAAMVAEKLLEQLTLPFHLNGHELSIGASIGISLYPSDSQSGSELLRFADLAMYHAKSEGGNHCRFYSKQLMTTTQQRLVFENDFQQSIDTDQLVLHFQPVIDLNLGEATLFEALVRWPRERLLYPEQFLSAAEKTDLILALDRWVLAQLAKLKQTWADSWSSSQRISINLSKRHFRKPEQLLILLQECLESAGLAPQQLVIEIVENTLIYATDAVIEMLVELRQRGVLIALDDFGAGYSSLSTLKALPVDILKVDGNFLTEVPKHPKNTGSLAAIIALGKALQMKIVAKGVETQAQFDWLIEQRCDYAQGYFLARPSAEPELSRHYFSGNPRLS